MCLYSYITIYTVRVSDEYQPVRESSEGAARKKKESVPNLEYSTEWETKKSILRIDSDPIWGPCAHNDPRHKTPRQVQIIRIRSAAF